ncbi:MAG: hypothetical protein MUF45_04450, partial [Spirosomaceae bacterium]|nr:hypothetical protein [Spirosomataceae bacterium]
MKKIFYFFMALLISLSAFAQTKTWTGATSTDWNTASNWSPSGVPSNLNDVVIPAATRPNNPVLNSNLTIKSLSVAANLTINAGATLNIVSDLNCQHYSNIYNVTNNGTVNVGGNTSLSGTASRNESTYYGVEWANNECARFNTTGNFVLFGHIMNTGYVYIGGDLNVQYTVSPFDAPNGFFRNDGVLKYTTISGVSYSGPLVANTRAGSVIVNNTPIPIFTYGGTYNGTVNGIFTNATATISAGTFVAPNTFTPTGLPAGSQTLYAKITPSGQSCNYVVPFTYNNVVATRPFITQWNLSLATGSGANQIQFGVETSGTVNYTWTTVPAGTSGFGSFSGTTATITGLPAGAIIDLSIEPTNFQRINV